MAMWTLSGNYWIVFKKYYAVTSDPIRMKLYVKSEPLLQI